jgi:hypothetical protein
VNEIIAICDIYHYPAYLKYTIDSFVINKKLRLSYDNFTYYIQVLSNFKETRDYVYNLINTSFDLDYPVRAEFYEFLCYNNLLEGQFDQFEKNIEMLRERYSKDYKEDIRSKIQFNGNTLMLKNFNDFISNLTYKRHLGLDDDEHDKHVILRFKDNMEKLGGVIEKLIAENKGKMDWLEDKEFVGETIRYYEHITILKNKF